MFGGVAIGLAVIFAVTTVYYRRWQKAREEARRAGASLRHAIPVRRFDQIERVLARRACGCGERLVLQGEDSSQIEERRYRVIRMLCPECEKQERVYFDVTEIFN